MKTKIGVFSRTNIILATNKAKADTTRGVFRPNRPNMRMPMKGDDNLPKYKQEAAMVQSECVNATPSSDD